MSRNSSYRRRFALRKIEENALDLLNEYHHKIEPLTEPPVPIYRLSSELLGLTITYEPLESHRLNSTRALEGAIDTSRGIVYINPERPDVKKTFSLAHEIGHLRLHNRLYDRTFKDPESSRISQSADERAANTFAAFLLMPKFLLKIQVRKFGTFNNERIESLSWIFSVSSKAMSIQLEDMDLLGKPGHLQTELIRPTVHARGEAQDESRLGLNTPNSRL